MKLPKVKSQSSGKIDSVNISKLDNHFNIKKDTVKDAVSGVIKFGSENPHLKNNLFNEEFPVFIQINSFKVPKAKGTIKQVFRVPLTNSPLPPEADICLIVPDVKGIPNKEHERHEEHYETLLRSRDVTGIKKIMTFHEFRTEYDTFELKNRLVDLYDFFLVDGRISGKVVHKCGNIFYKKRKLPVAIKLHLPKLKSQIDMTLKKSFFQININSDSSCVQIGHSKMKIKQLVENAYSVVDFIEKQFPGKMANIRSLNVYAYRGSSIPIYVSLKNPNDVEVPVLTSNKPKAYKSYTGELTTQYNADVEIKPSGHVIVRRSKVSGPQSDQNDDDNITDAEIVRENKKLDKTEDTSVGDKSKKGKKRKLSAIDTTDSVTENIQSTTASKEKSKKPTESFIKKKKGKTSVSNNNVSENAESKEKEVKKITNNKFKKGNDNSNQKTQKQIKGEVKLEKLTEKPVSGKKVKKTIEKENIENTATKQKNNVKTNAQKKLKKVTSLEKVGSTQTMKSKIKKKRF